ncbi:hypothetical protein EDD11_004696 [Mortierella claussenii]|nr:hypothetical protein EDD11_004696 [Mortierella claussenii]
MAAETSSTAPVDTHDGVHLVILHHGLWGNKNHVKFIAQQFKERFGDRILVYRAESNESSLTYDGIDICAQRAVQEIHEVIRVIEAGGNIADLRGQKNKKQSKKKAAPTDKQYPKKASSFSASSSSSSLDTSPENSVLINRNSSRQDHPSLDHAELPPKSRQLKKVTQFSFLGYSLGGLIGRFAICMLDMEKFFDPVQEGGRGIEPMYFVTMATPHLGIRKPPETTWSKMFNYVSSKFLGRTGEQMQLIDDYVGKKPLLLVMSEPESVFVKALARFKRRALYCNIRNDRSVPFWTASFSDADPFDELDSLQIQYNAGYSSLIESFEHYDLETLTRMQEDREASLKSATFAQRTSQRLSSIPWKKYILYGLLGPILIPLWIIIAGTTTIGQGYSSRRRTKHMVTASEELKRIRDRASAVKLDRYHDDDDGSEQSNSYTQQQQQHTQDSFKEDAKQEHSVIPVSHDPVSSPSTSGALSTEETPMAVSYSYPDLKSVRPLALLPVQIEISRNLNKLEWKKNIVHIEGWNSHASIVVRHKRFHHDGGVAAVQHAVDMFKEDGEDEP